MLIERHQVAGHDVALLLVMISFARASTMNPACIATRASSEPRTFRIISEFLALMTRSAVAGLGEVLGGIARH